jgi:hypothetical protein
VINFRFHVISLIAVFLALAVGVVMGYGVLGQPTVDTLQARIDTVEARADEVRAENDRLRAEQERLDGLLADVGRFAVTDRLAGTEILPVAVRGVDEAAVEETVALGRLGGAAVPGIVWLEGKWALTTDDDAAALAALVGSTATTRAGVRDDAARALATRLATGPVPGRPDLLAALDTAGFVSLQSVDGQAFTAATVDVRPRRFLLVEGNGAAVGFDRGVLPLATALAATGRPVAVAEYWREVARGPARGEALGAIRTGRLADQVATVDNFDTPDGPLLAVLVMGDLGQGVVAHYGFGAGAERAVPEWWGV